MRALWLTRDEEDADAVGVLLHTRREKEAARLFLDWFRQRGGRATRSEVSGFANALSSGKWGFRYGRTTFYLHVLGPFVFWGLIAQGEEYDDESRRVIRVYRRVIQPVQRRRPSGPSLIYNAHLISEKWNESFGE
jgi:hypothetical protein